MSGGNSLLKGQPPRGGRRQLFPELKALVNRAKKQAVEKFVGFKAFPKQVQFMQAVQTNQYRFMAFGGGIRSSKTICMLVVLTILCRVFPRSRWAIVRTDLPTLRRNVVPAMAKIIIWAGGFVGELNQSTWSYTCRNGSVILLFAEQFTQDPDLDRWKGLEVNGFLLEEGNELNERSANKAIERAGSYIIPATPEDPAPRQPPPFIFVTFNPCKEWPRQWFYTPWKNGTLQAPYYFLPATIADNPAMGEPYKATLKFLPPEEYKRFVEGEWDFIDDPNQLIKSEWVWAAESVEPVDGPTALGGDIARYGDDWTALYVIKGNQLRKTVNMQRFNLITVGNEIMNLARDHALPINGVNCKLDAVGLGAGVVDYCRDRGLPVSEIIAGAKPVPRPQGANGAVIKFYDLRSQMWWEAREKFRLRQFSLMMTNAKGEPIRPSEKLVGDLTSVKYEISSDMEVRVESKDDIKKRLGRSPDDGDALVSAMFDLPPAPKRPVLPGTIIVRGH